MSVGCGRVALDLCTYYAGANQATHPNVISFRTTWHGYRYYMAYTPYPYGNGAEENPCLAVSNDLLHWDKPEGLINPIACCEELECDELKDTHLLYRADLDRLEMWYLGRQNSSMAEGGELYCFRKVSSDGVTWGPVEEMYGFNGFNLASESVIWDGEEYRFWGIRNSREDTGLYYMHSQDGKAWSKLEKCNVPGATETHMWHGAVSWDADVFQYVWVGNTGADKGKIFYTESHDGLNFSAYQVIIENGDLWDFLYRPCLLIEDGKAYCYYGVIRHDGKWLISMSSGPSVSELQGLTTEDLGTTRQPISELCASTRKMKIKRNLKKLSGMFSIRLLLLAPLIFLLRAIFTLSPIAAWLGSVVLGVAMSYMMMDRNPRSAILQGGLMGTIAACVAGFAYEILGQIVSWFM